MAVNKADLCLYHWSPTERRTRILRHGLRVTSHSLDREWKPPYLCFSDDPRLAWFLSGRIHPEFDAWDLWMVFPQDLKGWEKIFDTYRATGRKYVKEYRVYHTIPKSNVRYVASRTQERVRGD